MMNRQERQIFFEILRSALWECKADLNVFAGEWQWENILRAYEKHSLIGVVADAIAKLPAEYQPDEQIMSAMMFYVGNLLQTHQRLNCAIGRLFVDLGEVGCFPILLKGQGLVPLYPKTCVRTCGDIDVYVGPEQMERAIAVINAKADAAEIAKAEANEPNHHYEIVIEGIVYEIHRYPGGAGNKHKEGQFKRLSVLALNRKNSETLTLDMAGKPACIAVPSLQVNSWYVFNHIVQHFHGGGVGLRQFCDWMMVLKALCLNPQAGIDQTKRTDEIVDTLETLGLTRAWRILSGILVYQLGFPSGALPLYDETLARQSQGFVLDQIVEGESFRFGLMPDGHRESNFLRRLGNSLAIYYKVSRSTFVISRLYPIRRFCDWIVYGAKRLWMELRG